MIFTMLLGISAAAMPQIELRGFGSRNDTEKLTQAFQRFIKTIPTAKFPIKIDRSKHLMGHNEYFWGSTEIGKGLLTGRRTINRSRTINPEKISRRDFQNLLDKEKWFSKIIIQRRGKNQYIVEKFGVGHAVYRGVMRSAKVAAFATAVAPPQFP